LAGFDLNSFLFFLSLFYKADNFRRVEQDKKNKRTMRKGQSALEYIMTYGWAILVVMIVLVVIVNLGLLDVGGNLAPGKSGFSSIVPIDWKCQGDTLTLLLANSAGEDLENLQAGGESCGDLDQSRTTTCTVSAVCPVPAKPYREEVIITYRRKDDSKVYQSSGVVWGTSS